MLNFKKRKQAPVPQEDRNAMCSACGHVFSKETGFSREKLNTKDVFWYCSNHEPNFDYIKEMRKSYRFHSIKANSYETCFNKTCRKKHVSHQDRWHDSLSNSDKDAWGSENLDVYFVRIPDKEVKPNFEI